MTREEENIAGTIIIGLGNPIVSDDSVGVCAARRLDKVKEVREVADVHEVYAGGLRLLDVLVGYKRAIIIDAMQTGIQPGTVRRSALRCPAHCSVDNKLSFATCPQRNLQNPGACAEPAWIEGSCVERARQRPDGAPQRHRVHRGRKACLNGFNDSSLWVLRVTVVDN
jgi:hypothetical protein